MLNWIGDSQEKAYQFFIDVALLPKTIIKIIFDPIGISRWVDTELVNDAAKPSTRFLNPFAFFLIVAVLPIVAQIPVGIRLAEIIAEEQIHQVRIYDLGGMTVQLPNDLSATMKEAFAIVKSLPLAARTLAALAVLGALPLGASAVVAFFKAKAQPERPNKRRSKAKVKSDHNADHRFKLSLYKQLYGWGAFLVIHATGFLWLYVLTKDKPSLCLQLVVMLIPVLYFIYWQFHIIKVEISGSIFRSIAVGVLAALASLTSFAVVLAVVELAIYLDHVR